MRLSTTEMSIIIQTEKNIQNMEQLTKMTTQIQKQFVSKKQMNLTKSF